MNKIGYILNVAKERGYVWLCTGWARYSCPMNEDQTKFKFKGKWHNVEDYIFEHTSYDG